MNVKPDRYYLRALRQVANAWAVYQPGELICNARTHPRSFIKLDRAVEAAREYGWPNGSLEVRRGDTIAGTREGECYP